MLVDKSDTETSTVSAGAAPNPVDTGSRRRAEVTRFDVMFAAAALAAELLVAIVPLVSAAPMAVALALHLFVVAALAYALYRRRLEDADLSAPLLAMIATSTAGPVGALVGLAALAWLARPALPSALLDAWYNRIALSTTVDPSTQLSERVASGRVIDTSGPLPQALVGIIHHGTLEEQQAALGLVARFFHMNYLAALSDALHSDIPVIRVQAAAVASRIRPRLAQEVNCRLGEAADLLRASQAQDARGKVQARHLQLIRELDLAIASRLLDKPIEDAAAATATHLASSIDCMQLPLPVRNSLEASAVLQALEGHLIASGEFKSLRLLRARGRLASRGLPRSRLRPNPRIGAQFRASTSKSPKTAAAAGLT